MSPDTFERNASGEHTRPSWIVVGSANGSTNLGDECMWEAAVETVRDALGPVHIVTDSFGPWQPPVRDVTVLPNLVFTLRRGELFPQHWKRFPFVTLLTRVISRPWRNAFAQDAAARALTHPRHPSQHEWLEQIKRCEGLIVSGAGAITDDYAPHGISSWSLLVGWAKQYNKPIALVGQGIGPVRSKGLIRTVAQMLQQADLITVREERSRTFALQLGVPPGRVTLSHDWALTVSPQPEDRARAAALRDRLVGSSPFLAVSFHRRHSTTRAQLAVLARLLEELVIEAANRGMRVLFVPNMIGAAYSDDRQTARMLAAQWAQRTRSNFAVQSDAITPRVARALLTEAVGLVTTRYHPMVFAFSERTPCVGISYDAYYDQKLGGLSQLFGVAENVHRLDSPTLSSEGIFDALTRQRVFPLTRASIDQVRAPLTEFLRSLKRDP